MEADRLIGVREAERMLMAPKLLAKTRAQSSNLSESEVFRVRALSAQIGWLETSMVAEAARAISSVKLLLSTGSESLVAIDLQLRVFAANEHGLLATWETPDSHICMPRFATPLEA